MDKIIRQYDPDNDVRSGGPTVTWAEHDLAVAVKLLAERLAAAESRIEFLERRYYDPGNREASIRA
jgi:hypothetical protein